MTEPMLTRAEPKDCRLVFSDPLARRMTNLNRLGRLDVANTDGAVAFWGRLLACANTLWDQHGRARASHCPPSQILGELKEAGSEVPSALKKATNAAWELIVQEVEGIPRLAGFSRELVARNLPMAMNSNGVRRTKSRAPFPRRRSSAVGHISVSILAL